MCKNYLHVDIENLIICESGVAVVFFFDTFSLKL